VAAAFTLLSRTDPDVLLMPLQPLAVPALPPLAVVGLLIAALPAVLTPAPPPPVGRRSVRGAPVVVTRG
jgi:energy-coupling factor transport system permease protein